MPVRAGNGPQRLDLRDADYGADSLTLAQALWRDENRRLRKNRRRRVIKFVRFQESAIWLMATTAILGSDTRLSEMLGQFETLCLIVGFQFGAVQ